MPGVRDRAAASIVAFLLLLPAAYVGSYFALLDPLDRYDYLGKPGVDFRQARFRIEHGWTKAAYWPLLEADRRLRPEYWNPP